MGLAAPQVGVNVRLMVFNETGDKEKRDKEVVLVNPRIVSSSKDAKVFEEGCLSFPKIYGDVIVSHDTNAAVRFPCSKLVRRQNKNSKFGMFLFAICAV